MEEFILHIIQDCSLARKVWDQLLPYNARAHFFLMIEKEWLVFNIFQKRYVYLRNNMSWNIYLL